MAVVEDYASTKVSARSYFSRQLSRLKNERDQWMTRSQLLSQYILPEYDRWLSEGKENRDEANFASIVDNTATLASEILSSGLMTGVTNPARRWFELRHPDPDIDANEAVSVWLHEVTGIMHEHLGRSNLYNTLPTLYQEMGVFGTGVIFADDDPLDVLRFYAMPPGEYYLGTDYRGMVNVFYAEMPMTVTQVVEKFGVENVSSTVRNQYEQRNYTNIVKVIHAIEPVEGPDIIGVHGSDGLSVQHTYFSVYYEKNNENGPNQGLLHVGGYYEFPVMAPRWSTVSRNVYGYGRGHKALGDIMMLQHQQKVKAEAVEKLANPPMKAPSGTDRSEIDMRPGMVSLFDATLGKDAFSSAYEVRIDLPALIQDIQEIQDRIQRTFFVDAFQMMQLMDNRAQITAREIDERREEKLLRLGAVLLRLNDELLDPLIARTFGALSRAGVFPEAPREFVNTPARIEYTNILSQVQRAQGIASAERFVGFVGNMVSMMGGDTSPFNMVNIPEQIHEYGQSVGVSPKVLRSVEEAEEMARQAKLQQQLQQMTAMAAQGAETARDLGNTPTSADNALGAIGQRMSNQ